MKKLLVLGGGVVGWFTAALLKKHHPDIDITLVESPHVPILGVGESTVPQLGELLSWLDVDENTWMKATHGIHKLGNHFVGWNTEKPMTHVTDHWNAKPNEYHFYAFSFTPNTNSLRNNVYNPKTLNDYFYDNDGKFGVDNKTLDYWLEMVRRGKYKWWQTDQYTMEQYHPAMNNRAARYNDNYPTMGAWNSYAWHIDAERFPKVIRDMVALPLGVKHLTAHVEHINKNEEGYVTSLKLDNGQELEADLYCDCTGFNRVLMKTMDVKWQSMTHLPTQSAWVAPVKYNDPYKEMKPYTQSYANKSGWNFIISLYSRMGSGYIFDASVEDKDTAREDFIKYWDGYEFIRDPRLIQWDQGYYDKAWDKNVVGIGMAQGFVDPMEANSIYVAQSCIQMLDQVLSKYKDKPITETTRKAYSKQIQKHENQIGDFISYHFTLSKRRDTPFWRKWGTYGVQNNHIEKNWNEYRAPHGYIGRNVFLDYQWPAQQMYLDRWDDSFCKLNIDESLMPLAEADYNYLNSKGKAIANAAPHVYDWSMKNLHDGKTHTEVLEEALAERK